MKDQHLFILSYKGAKFLEDNRLTNALHNTEIHIVDNGQQEWTALKDKVIHTTLTNVGCAGGWSIIADIAFKHFQYDKIVIANDDVYYTDSTVDKLFAGANDQTIYGPFDRSFEFSLFCITRKVYELVGKPDENIMYTSCEDDDLKWRCHLSGIDVICLNKSADANLCMSSRELTREQRTVNIGYVARKWGEPRQYTAPFDGKEEVVPSEALIKQYSSIYSRPFDSEANFRWPSEYEFERFLANKLIERDDYHEN